MLSCGMDNVSHRVVIFSHGAAILSCGVAILGHGVAIMCVFSVIACDAGVSVHFGKCSYLCSTGRASHLAAYHAQEAASSHRISIHI